MQNRRLFQILVILVLAGICSVSLAATPTNCLSTIEKQLIDEINVYRNQNGLPSVPASKSLTLVGQWHVIDLYENSPNTGQCNMHSWSNQHPTLWSAVCYTPDHQNALGMWNKPSEITNNVYSAYGYENAYMSSGTLTATSILNGWKSSPGHNAVILEQDIWAGRNWPAMGVGIYKGYAVLWFGDQADPQGTVSVCGSGGSTGTTGGNKGSLAPMFKIPLLKQ